MPKLDKDFDAAPESSAGEFSQLTPGVYECIVQAVRTEWTKANGSTENADSKQCVKLILDIAEGEHAAKFSDDYWAGADKDWGHTLWVSWKPTALGMLKHTFHAFDDANGGFDARAAFEADKWELFIGKRVHVVWNGEEYVKNNGDTALRVRPSKAVLADERAKPYVRLEDGRSVKYDDYAAQQAATSTGGAVGAYADDEIPF